MGYGRGGGGRGGGGRGGGAGGGGGRGRRGGSGGGNGGQPQAAAAPTQGLHPRDGGVVERQSNSMLQSDIKFSELNLSAGTMRAMNEGFGYEYCTPVQAASVPVAMAGFDVLARAKTGTGKTLGFMIPAIERLMLSAPARQGSVAILVLSPTRELTAQIAKEGKIITRYHPGLEVSVMMGGTNADKERKVMCSGGSGPAHILVATPGRLEDHLYNTRGFAGRFEDLRTLVFDEADQMLDMGFRPTIEKILRALPPPGTRQTLLYSATVPTAMQQIAKQALRPGEQQRFVDCVVSACGRVPWKCRMLMRGAICCGCSQGEDGGATADKLEQFHVAVPLDGLIAVRGFAPRGPAKLALAMGAGCGVDWEPPPRQRLFMPRNRGSQLVIVWTGIPLCIRLFFLPRC
jgi:hypothetical protein